MKRKTFNATITDTATTTELASSTTQAWNSGIRATEALLREYARANDTIFESPHNPTVVGGMSSPDRQYMRTWHGRNGQTVVASVWESK